MSTIFAIGDLHLSGEPPKKPMVVFGEQWRDHWRKISASWRQSVQERDVVLIAGDISWAMDLEEAMEDLNEIHQMPGQKILVKGNHDFWWSTAAKMKQQLPASISFIHNSFIPVGDIAVCGSRGWVNPYDSNFTAQDQKIYEREEQRIAVSLAAAQKEGYKQQIVVTHFPMFYQGQGTERFLKILNTAQVEHYIFGHLHGEGIVLGPGPNCCPFQCHLVSCDALHFQVKKIMEV
ncbi:Hypothetical protein LUCI_2062 [Lucifera butyrica]|uniref:Calcineurin-like phosphoesterase domain-containing protein n=1 Tax=Lucifera butyrica TaxID=1351585 RepID=A0A498R6Y4_9FIRM|nr:metallophosphoesterase [Lucifera butyrica]VBB06825.1 Hypothetical protein LUCI_2062 [Lucifera butyrica]